MKTCTEEEKANGITIKFTTIACVTEVSLCNKWDGVFKYFNEWFNPKFLVHYIKTTMVYWKILRGNSR